MGDAPVYAVNTGVGLLADVRVPPDELEQLQRNVIRSHACGVGAPLARDEVRGMMLIRANVLAKGFSGIRPVVAERLCDLLNRGVTPVVPSQGSVGASGDLAPLAHIALVLIGEGEADFDGAAPPWRRSAAPSRNPTHRAGVQGRYFARQRHPGHALGGRLAVARSRSAGRSGRPDLRHDAGWSARHAARLRSAHSPDPPVPRPDRKARLILLRYLEGSEIRQSHITCRRVQDAYSLRCAPQVHGAVRDALATARRAFEIELNSVTDNPLVIDDEIFSGGNFHGEPLALQLDAMAVALTVLGGISERRIDRLVNPSLNEELPPFLANHAGLESGFMMVQVTAAALVAENRVLAYPASTGSITTSGNKEDFVSMGMTSAMKLKQVVRNTRHVLAIEMLTATRALDCLRPLDSSPVIERVRTALAAVSAPWTADRSLTADIENTSAWIGSGGSRAFLERDRKGANQNRDCKGRGSR